MRGAAADNHDSPGSGEHPMPRLKLQVDAIKVSSFDIGGGGEEVQQRTLDCTWDCVVTAGVNSCWCSEYATCDCV
jgi:hypothetical protein